MQTCIYSSIITNHCTIVCAMQNNKYDMGLKGKIDLMNYYAGKSLVEKLLKCAFITITISILTLKKYNAKFETPSNVRIRQV